VNTLEKRIEFYYSQEGSSLDRPQALKAFEELKFFLNAGEIRAASPDRSPDTPTGWRVNTWVKKGILLGFRLGDIVDRSINDSFRFFDKSTYPLRKTTAEHHVRIVPGGSSIRDGAYVAPGVVVMPPAYINTGAYVDEGTMIDSHALVGSCAQIGRKVHLSAAAQIGGVLEPIGAWPVIVEDEVFIGGNCGIYEGTIVRRRAVLAPGVLLTRAIPVFDLVRGTVHRADGGMPLVIPEGAVLVPGSRAVESPFGREHGIGLYAPVIVKYRDERTDASTTLEQSLR
jgi:2,3,4,5-tetrahydropyridine-2-carboxylate N-succinyltransferase